MAMNTLMREDANGSFRVSQAWANKKFIATLHICILFIYFWSFKTTWLCRHTGYGLGWSFPSKGWITKGRHGTLLLEDWPGAPVLIEDWKTVIFILFVCFLIEWSDSMLPKQVLYFSENDMNFFSHLSNFGHIISTKAIHFSSSITLVPPQVIFNTLR